MKVIFLDIDGVLNSKRYSNERDWRTQGNIDETRLPLLRRIVEETGAVIVLTTTWREYWNPDPALWDPRWQQSGEAFAHHGLEIFDRTPAYEGNNRDCEVRDWLAAHKDEVESFVILDDMHLGWGDLADRLVQTSARIGRGLMENHVEKAIQLLMIPISP